MFVEDAADNASEQEKWNLDAKARNLTAVRNSVSEGISRGEVEEQLEASALLKGSESASEDEDEMDEFLLLVTHSASSDALH